MAPAAEDAVPRANTTSASGGAGATNTTRRLQAASSTGDSNNEKPGPLPSTVGVPAHSQQSQGHGLAQALGLGHALQGLALGKAECAVLNNTLETQPCTDTCPGYCAGTPESAAGIVRFMWQCPSGNYNGTACAGTCSLRFPKVDPVTGTAEALCTNGTFQNPDHSCLQRDG
jgi:hypothetical protein